MVTNKSKNIAYFFLRIAMGINIMSHGLVRLPKIDIFRQWMVDSFEKSPLFPSEVVYLWATVLPFIEFIIGLFLILGFYTYKTSIAGAIMIVILLFGSCMIEKWDWAGTQMIYMLFYYFIIKNIDKNIIALDLIINRKK